MSLENWDTEELQKELVKRGAAPIPEPVENASPDFSELVATVKAGVAEAIKETYEDEDFKHYVYEAAIEAVYGDTYWKWKRAKL